MTRKVFDIYAVNGTLITTVTTYDELNEYRHCACYYKEREIPSYNRKVTVKMVNAVAFIEMMEIATFKGDIDNFQQVSSFIGKYLDSAKEKKEYYDEIVQENMGYDDWRG